MAPGAARAAVIAPHRLPTVLRRALGVGLVFVVAACGSGDASGVERSAPTDRSVAPTTTVEEPSTTAPVTSTTTAPPAAAPDAIESIVAPSPGAWTVAPYYGFGAWLDVFDWSIAFAGAGAVGPEAIDHMAAEGVETLYIQASRWNSEADVLEPERLQRIIDRAHAHGLAVIAWYLPTMVDPEVDLRRMLAMTELGVDGFGVDIESREVLDVGERNRRLVELSTRLDEALGDRTLAAIVMEPVVMEDVNPNYWPGYPWAELAPHYDVWMPMGYWTNRRGMWRDAFTYTATNIARIRERIGQPDALVHPIGGIGDETTVDDLTGMLAAAVDQRAIGGSIYDYPTTRPEHWELLRSFRSGSGPA